MPLNNRTTIALPFKAGDSRQSVNQAGLEFVQLHKLSHYFFLLLFKYLREKAGYEYISHFKNLRLILKNRNEILLNFVSLPV